MSAAPCGDAVLTEVADLALHVDRYCNDWGETMLTNEQMDQLADRFFGAIERIDRQTIEDSYTADAVVWHNWDGVAQPRAENVALLASIPEMFRTFKYTNVRRHLFANGWVQQHVAEGIKTDGKPFAIFACMVISVRGDKIARIDEYADSKQLPVQP